MCIRDSVPSVKFKVVTTKGAELEVSAPSEMPEPTYISWIEEPFIKAQIITKSEYIGPILKPVSYTHLDVYKRQQYNSQFENMNINTRFQWRFAPVSDFFLVYIDNYNTINGESRNRSIQAKLTYWFNL